MKLVNKSNITDALPVAPLALFTAALLGLPLLYILRLSFLAKGARGGVIYEFTAANYTRILDPLYLRIFAVSLGVAVVTCVTCLAIGYPFAYFMARLERKARNIVMFLVMVPFWTSSLLRVYGWMIVLRNDGPVNGLMLALGIIDAPVTLLYNYGAVMVGTVYILLPLMILPVYNSALKLDESLLEASRDLGAGKVRTFINITLPLTMPGVMAGVTLVFIPAVGLFFISDLLGGAKTMLIGSLVRSQMTSARDWPFGAALSVIMTLCVLITAWLYARTIKKTGGGGLI